MTRMGTNERTQASVHVDLDGGADIFAAHGWTYELEGDPMFASGLANALDFFDVEDARATFFVIARDLGDLAKRPLLEEIVRRGHAVASHTTTHRLLPTLSTEEKRREVFESKARIEAELGVEVEGFRAPGFAIDRESLELVAEAGYAYDSSLFPTQRDAAKTRLQGVLPFPHRPLEGRELIEVPMPSHGRMPFPFHPSYSLVLGTWYFRLGLRRTEHGVPLVLLFHLTDFAEPLPYEAIGGVGKKLFTISHLSARTKRERCRKMLARVRRDYELVPTRALFESAQG